MFLSRSPLFHKFALLTALSAVPLSVVTAQDLATPATNIVLTGGLGWSKSQVNAAIFRTNSLVSHDGTQYTAFYGADSSVILGKRALDSQTWELQKTRYKGNASDAHDAICLGIDGSGVLHMSWGMHGNKLRYVQNTAPGSLELTPEMPMTGADENSVTYPQFYTMPNGDLLFLYRDGASGNGNAMLNRYDVAAKTWESVAHPLVAGGGQRNAYLNTLAVDAKGGVHISWVWRDTPAVETNHDVCYAFSPDGGENWQKSNGDKYNLPITIDSAEVAWKVPQNSELINQTSMTTDAAGHPLIATYWRDQKSEVPQYRLVWNDGEKWQMSTVGQRTMPFRLSGGGTKKIPISRPQIVATKDGKIVVIFRDEERGNGISVATSSADYADWQVINLLEERMGNWEPSYDPEVWKSQGRLDLFVQRVGQGDAETLENIPPQQVAVLEWTPQ